MGYAIKEPNYGDGLALPVECTVLGAAGCAADRRSGCEVMRRAFLVSARRYLTVSAQFQ